MGNYEKAVKLLNKGIAKPHYTYDIHMKKAQE